MLRALLVRSRTRIASVSQSIAMAEHSQGRVTRRRAKRAREALIEDLQLVAERLKAYSLKSSASKPVSTKLAAVLVPLFSKPEAPGGSIRVLLTQRSDKLLKHQGEVCLPGGKRDPEDPDDVAAALREAHEELGLAPGVVQVLGPLPPFLSKHYLSVTPVPALVPPDRQAHAPQPNPDEVAEVFDVPLALFLGNQHHSSRDIKWQDYTYRIHYFDFEGHTIWGLTAAMLIKVAKVAFEQEPEFEEHSSPDSQYTRFWYDGNKLCVHTLARPHGSDDAESADQPDEGCRSGGLTANQQPGIPGPHPVDGGGGGGGGTPQVNSQQHPHGHSRPQQQPCSAQQQQNGIEASSRFPEPQHASAVPAAAEAAAVCGGQQEESVVGMTKEAFSALYAGLEEHGGSCTAGC